MPYAKYIDVLCNTHIKNNRTVIARSSPREPGRQLANITALKNKYEKHDDCGKNNIEAMSHYYSNSAVKGQLLLDWRGPLIFSTSDIFGS
jgi:hypothetical protein